MTDTRVSRRTLAPALFALSFAPFAHAQTAPPPGTVLRLNTPPPALPAAPGNVLTLPAPEQQQGQSSTPIPVTHIRVEGNALLASSTLAPLVNPLQGRTVTLGDLQQAAQRIAALYRAQGYPLANAFVPAQTIKDGVVRIQVVEPTYDRIAVQGSRLVPSQAQRTLGVSAGQPIEQSALDRGLLLLNRTPGVRVAGTLVPGAQPGTSSLQVKLSDGPLVHTRLHADNYGSDYTGRTRGGVDVSVDNPFGHGAQAALTTLTSVGGRLHAGGFSVTSPDLHNGLRAGAYGSRTLYRLGGAFAALDQSGRVNQIGLDASYPLVLEPGRLLSLRVDALRNGFVQRSVTVGTTSRSHLREARVGMDGAWADTHGVTSGGLSVSRGMLSMDSPDARVADTAGAHARGGFWVARLQVQRDQPLPREWQMQLNLSAQMASHSLDGSEKFYLGGPYGVMSAPVDADGGEAGALFTARFSHALAHPFGGPLNGALLLQGGKVWLRPTAAGGAQSARLAGAGMGLDYQWKQALSLHVAYVHGIGSNRTTAGARAGNQWWIGINADL